MKIETNTLFNQHEPDGPQPNYGDFMWLIQQRILCTVRAVDEANPCGRTAFQSNTSASLH